MTNTAALGHPSAAVLFFVGVGLTEGFSPTPAETNTPSETPTPTLEASATLKYPQPIP